MPCISPSASPQTGQNRKTQLEQGLLCSLQNQRYILGIWDAIFRALIKLEKCMGWGYVKKPQCSPIMFKSSFFSRFDICLVAVTFNYFPKFSQKFIFRVLLLIFTVSRKLLRTSYFIFSLIHIVDFVNFVNFAHQLCKILLIHMEQ